MVWFWQQDYNQNRTYEMLNNLPPDIYRKQLDNSNRDCFRSREWATPKSKNRDNRGFEVISEHL